MLFNWNKSLKEEIQNGSRDDLINALISEYEMLCRHSLALGSDVAVFGPHFVYSEYNEKYLNGDPIALPVLAFGVMLLGDVNYEVAENLGYSLLQNPKTGSVYVQKKFGTLTKAAEKKLVLQRMCDKMEEQMLIEKSLPVTEDFVKIRI